VQEHDIAATYQKISTHVIDVETLRAKGYKFDDAGDIVATPSGDRVLRASAVKEGSAAKKTAGAASGSEGYVRELLIPAEYRTVSHQVIDQPATVRQVEVPATYKTVTSRVVKTAASTQEVVIPAVYKTVTRQVVDQEASTREIAVPAQYATVSRKVVDTAPSAREIPVPAKMQTLAHQVVDREAAIREEAVPAVYKTVTRQLVDQPAGTREVDVPAVYQSLSRQVKVADASTEWRSILCEVNATPTKIREIQTALKAAGYNPGQLDGVVHTSTMRAVNDYQAAKGLPVDSYMNLETVKSLGVAPH
jgi:Putative peptidoglycan binding domain